MHPSIRLPIFIFSLTAFTACSSDGSRSNSPPKNNLKLNTGTNLTSISETSDNVEHAYLYLEQTKQKYSLNNPRAQLIFKNAHTDDLHNKHLKFQQAHNGVPVWGSEIIVHLDKNNSTYSISGEILTEINLLNARPDISKESASNIVMKNPQWGGKGWQVKGIELFILNQNGNNTLAYRLALTKGLLREFIFINAHDGEIIKRISGTHTTN